MLFFATHDIIVLDFVTMLFFKTYDILLLRIKEDIDPLNK